MEDLKTASDNDVDELFIAQPGAGADYSLEFSCKALISFNTRTTQNRDGVLRRCLKGPSTHLSDRCFNLYRKPQICAT